MALPILDGNQSATTLSTILSSGQHITAHTVVSLGTQAITDISGAVSGSVVSISNFPATQPVSIASVTIGNTVTIAGTVTANINDPTNSLFASQINDALFGSDQLLTALTNLPISGTVTANLDPNASVIASQIETGIASYAADLANNPLPISGTVTIGSALPAGTNRIGVVTIGAGSVTLGAGTAEIGTVKPAKSQSGNAQFLSVDDGSGKLFTSTLLTAGTAQIGSVTASISNSITIGSLPAISGTVTANAGDTSFFVSGLDVYAHRSVLYSSSGNGFANDDGSPVDIDNPLPIVSRALQGTAVTTSNFTSTTASTLLAGFNAGREVLTIFNEGAGNLFVCPGATCTTVQYQIRLSSGDYYEVPNHQTTITHSAVFSTAGTARVTEVS